MNDAINEKVEKTTTEYGQEKSSTNIWTGQLLLINNDEEAGEIQLLWPRYTVCVRIADNRKRYGSKNEWKRNISYLLVH